MTAPELKGPIRSSRFIHRAILTEAQAFKVAATDLDVDDNRGPANLKERLHTFERVLKLHEAAEELVVFPPLESRYPYIAQTYGFDHQRHRQLSTALVATLDELYSARNGRRHELVKLLGEQAVAFNGFMNLHIEKEDVLLFPAYDETFSSEEQGAHSRATKGKLDPADIAKAGIWGFQRLQVDDREAFLREMQAMLPREAFVSSSKGLALAVSADDWQEMVTRIPDMDQAR